jgi:hypothetical protein
VLLKSPPSVGKNCQSNSNDPDGNNPTLGAFPCHVVVVVVVAVAVAVAVAVIVLRVWIGLLHLVAFFTTGNIENSA